MGAPKKQTPNTRLVNNFKKSKWVIIILSMILIYVAISKVTSKIPDLLTDGLIGILTGLFFLSFGLILMPFGFPSFLLIALGGLTVYRGVTQLANQS